jgi:hypothetical protein
MSMGLDHLNAAMRPVLQAQQENAMLRNLVTREVIEKRDRIFTEAQGVMSSGFLALNHTMIARGGMIDVQV